MSDDFFEPGSVVWDLRSRDKYEAIRETVERTTIFRTIPNLDLGRFTEAVVAREREQSTGFGHGIAIAHGRTVQVATSKIALGVSRSGVEFNAIDGKPVHLLFIVASHPERQIDYLRILSSLATMARNELFRRDMMSCIGAEDAERTVYTAFNGVLRQSFAG